MRQTFSFTIGMTMTNITRIHKGTEALRRGQWTRIPWSRASNGANARYVGTTASGVHHFMHDNLTDFKAFALACKAFDAANPR